MKKLILIAMLINSIDLFAQQTEHSVNINITGCIDKDNKFGYCIHSTDAFVYDSSFVKTQTVVVPDKQFVNIKLPQKGDVMNGISTLDLVLIQKHILGLQVLKDPYALLAADVNNNGIVSISDLIQLRRAILGLQTPFSGNLAYRDVCNVVPTKQKDDIWSFQIEKDETISVIRVKVGDVNFSGCNGTVRTAQPFPIVMADQYLKTGDTYTFSLPMQDIDGIQGTIQYDTETLDLIATDEYSNEVVDGKIAFAQLKDDAMKVTFRVKKHTMLSQAISLTSEQLNAEAYNEQAEIMTPILTFDNKAEKSQTLAAKVFPNPAHQHASIRISTADESDVVVNIYDALGKMVYTTQLPQQKGEVNLPLYLPQQGYYSYQVIQSKQMVSGKLLIQ